MDTNTFLNDFIDLFDDTDASEIKLDTKFHDLDEWSSLLGMAVIAMAKTQYGKTITGAEIRSCESVEDLYNMVNNK